MIPYRIISTGSKGNAVVVNRFILIDCDVPFKSLTPVIHDLKLVLLTHIHSDHFNPATIRRLSQERPLLRFACCDWLAHPLIDSGVPADRIDVLNTDTMYSYGSFTVTPVMLVHNVPNCGYKIHFQNGKVFYATDTNNLNGISAKSYDLYLVEANYEDETVQEKIAEKKAAGEFSYEMMAIQNHLSKAKCDDFLYNNMASWSKYAYLHCHEEMAFDYISLWDKYSETLAPLVEDGDYAAIGRLTVAMMDYKAGREPKLEGNERYVWPNIKMDIDSARKSYETKSQNSRKGGHSNTTVVNTTEADESKTDNIQEQVEGLESGHLQVFPRWLGFESALEIRHDCRRIPGGKPCGNERRL